MSGGLPCAAIGARRARTSALSGSTVLKAPTRIGLRRWSARAAWQPRAPPRVRGGPARGGAEATPQVMVAGTGFTGNQFHRFLEK